MQGILRGLKQLALIAMIVHALLPAGWMPSHDPSAPFVICTMNGPLQHAPDNGKLPANRHDICPFAAAPHLASTPELPQIIPPVLQAQAATADRAYAAVVLTRFTPGSPRAPPLAA